MIRRPTAPVIAALALTALTGCAIPISKMLPWPHSQSALRPYYAINDLANSAYSSRNYLSAVNEYGKMIEMRPNKFDGYSLRGMAYFQMHNYSSTVADDTQAISVISTPAGIAEIGYGDETPQQQRNCLPIILATLYFDRALAYHNMQDNTHALADYTSAFANNPAIVDAHGARAEVYVDLKQFANAVSDCNVEIQNHPAKWQLYYVRGKAYAGLGNLNAARADLIKASNYDHGKEGTVELNVKVLEDAHDYVGAAQVEKIASDTDPSNAHAWGAYGWHQYLAGDIPGAIASDLKATGIANAPVWVHANLGLCYAVQGDWAKANLEYALEKTDQNPTTRQGSVEDIRNALKQQPSNTTLKQALTFMTAV